jgi:hypothetical protein
MVFSALKLTPSPGGILSLPNVTYHVDSDLAWAGGSFAWDMLACPLDASTSDLCSGAHASPVASTTLPPHAGEGWPIGLVVGSTCSTVGLSLERAQERVRNALEAGTSKLLEHELMTGAALTAAGRATAFLADTNAVAAAPAGAGVALGIAALEQFLGDCGVGTEGTIHMSRSAALIAAQQHTIFLAPATTRPTHTPARFYTALGTPVVVGAGYSPTPSTVPIPTTTTMYATGPVAVHLGPITVLDGSHAVKQNTLTALAARPAAVYWDSCCHAKATVDLTKTP